MTSWQLSKEKEIVPLEVHDLPEGLGQSFAFLYLFHCGQNYNETSIVHTQNTQTHAYVVLTDGDLDPIIRFSLASFVYIS